MKEYFLEEHSSLCRNNTGEYYKDFCKYNPERFLFFVGNKFVLVTYHQCLEFGERYEFKKSIIDAIIKNNKIFDLYKVDRSINIEKELKSFRIKNQALKKYIQQVNFIYSDNANKSYAITTKTDFLEHICNQEEIDENYKKAKSFLKDKKYDWLLDDLDNLFMYNKVYDSEDTEYHKTIEILVKSINQLIK